MISIKSATTFVFLAAWVYFGTVGKTSKQPHVRGSELEVLHKRNRELQSRQQEAGIDFSTGQIVNGNTASNRPYFTHFGSGICGGILISPDRVLTAAHCVAGGAPSTVRVGATTQSDGTVVDVKCANTHPDYDGFVGNDLAVIKLENTVPDTFIAMNIDATSPATSETLTVIGLGRVCTGCSVSSVLLEVDQTYVEPSACDSAYGGGGVVDANQVLCALASNAGSCNGDSGGPLVDANDILHGIVSFGSSAGCAAGVPDGYTRVSNYNEWITNQIFSTDCDCTFWDSFCLGIFSARDAVVNYALSFYRGEDSA